MSTPPVTLTKAAQPKRAKKKPQRANAGALNNIVAFPHRKTDMTNANAATLADQPSKMTLEDMLSDVLCATEALGGSIHALIIGLEGGSDLEGNPHIMVRALYGCLRQLDALDNTIKVANRGKWTGSAA